MNKKIYWYCFKRQCWEFYELLTLYKLISCSRDEFMSHFTGKKFHDDEIHIGDLILWHGSETLLDLTARYLAEKGFIDKEIGSSNPFEDHFSYSDIPAVSSKKFLISLKTLFPETTGYRCKTRLYYKKRNRTALKEIIETSLHS
ncbi:MAG TPA: hypothetical protein PK605_09030 [Ignavibacteria bacterium]|nr:hypothetical protein [Bacteroidota bacterium]HRE12275.1 hypothetical protein [Ignavibacteria bacterium]HRF65849.1 hypothetical protein [Ignavibacteria bacterium]HRJ04529.1 hypothetical protein [Ignavibacteria bacterium]